MKSFLLECREVVKATPAGDKRDTLRMAVDALDKALADLSQLPSVENMIVVNAMWALTKRVLKIIHNPAPLPPLSGEPEVWLAEAA